MSCSPLAAPTQGLRKTVSVNGVVIAHDLISRETQNHPAANPVSAWTAATRALVVRELLLQEASRARLCPQPLTDDMGRCETDSEALVRSVIESQVRTPSPDDASCRRYYQANIARFRSADIFECAHILIAARRTDVDAYAAARACAEALLAHLSARPGDFSDLASAQSDCPSRAVAGNLGQVTSGTTTPEFEAAVQGLAPGEVSGLVETRYGLHIIRLDRRITGEQLPFEYVQPQIAAYLSDRAQRMAVAQYIALLASRAQVVGVDLPTPAKLRVH